MASESSSSDPSLRARAVALTYDKADRAPKVVAKGRGVVAQEIIERAKAAGVYVHESPELLSLLMQVDLDEHIPPTLYLVIAELLAWLYRVEAGAGADMPLPEALRPKALQALQDESPPGTT